MTMEMMMTFLVTPIRTVHQSEILLRTLLSDEASDGSDDDDLVRMKQPPTSCLKRPTQGFSTRMHCHIRSAYVMMLTLYLFSCLEALF